MRLIRCIVGICLSIMIVVALIVGLTRSQPIPAALQLLHFEDCELPCWIGIIPGKTTIGEAERRIAQTYANRTNYSIFSTGAGYWDYQLWDKATSRHIRLRLNSFAGQPASTIVDEIFITLEGEKGLKVRLGELENLLGQPENIRLSAGAKDVEPVLIYGNGQIHAFTGNTACFSIKIDELVDSLAISSQFPRYYAVSQPLTWSGYSRCNRFGQ